MTGSAFDALGERKAKPSMSGGDYADWWSPHKDDPEKLAGVIVEAHDTKFNEEDDPSPVFTVRSFGDPHSDFEKGAERSTRTHVQLVRGMENVELGDLVILEYTGLEIPDGSNNATNTYEVGVVKQDEWQDMDEADDLQELIDDFGGMKTDTRGEGADATNSDSTKQSAFSATETSVDDSDDDGAESFAQGIMEMQNGSMTVEQLDKMLNDVRNFGVDVEELCAELDWDIEDGTVTAFQ